MEILDPELRRQLTLTTADLRFAENLVKMASENQDDLLFGETGVAQARSVCVCVCVCVCVVCVRVCQSVRAPGDTPCQLQMLQLSVFATRPWSAHGCVCRLGGRGRVDPTPVPALPAVATGHSQIRR